MTTELKTADIGLIQDLLPHRYPFLLIDRVESIDGYSGAVGIKNVTMNEPHFQGHFPGRPIMPGVMIVEAMAQTSAVMVGTSLDLAGKGMQVYFMAIDKCKFRRMVVPGDRLELHMNTVRGKPGAKVWKFAGTARVGDDVACEVEFTAMMETPAP